MKMFGYSGSNNNLPYDLFRWQNFKQNEMILRILPNYFSDRMLFNRVYLHQIGSNFYLHPTNKECPLCSVLNGDEKYSEIQDKILKLKLQNKKEKWQHVITNHVNIGIFAIVKGYNKIQLIRFYDDMANQFLNIVIAKDIKDDITNLKSGNSVKLLFNRLNYFPYLELTDIVIGKSKSVFEDKTKIEELDNQLHNKSFEYNKKALSLDEAENVIDEWYTNAIRFYNTYSSHNIKEASLFTNNDLNENKEVLNNNLNENKDDFDFDNITDESSDEIPF